MPDDVIGVARVGIRLIESGEKFLERLVGPWLDEKGQQLADRLRLQRRLNLATIAGQAQDLVGDLEIHPTPSYVLNPLLDAAANSDAPELQPRWAALLANTATGSTEDVIPAYTEILRQLTPIHAKMLDWLYAIHGDSTSLETNTTAVRYDAIGYQGIKSAAICSRFGLTANTYSILANDLHRLRVIDGQRFSDGAMGVSSTSATDYSEITITPLGRAFVRACTARLT